MGDDVAPMDQPIEGRVLDDGYGESVRLATDEALRAIQPPARARGLVAVIRRMADLIDAQGPTGLTPDGKLDNVSIPTYLKYADALGMTAVAPKAETRQTAAARTAGSAVIADLRERQRARRSG